MKRGVLPIVFVLASLVSYAQPVSKRVVVEHFTNTYCSVCASRNPGFYANLWQFPQVMHLSVFPSAPYPACPLNQHNKPDNDARTNYYGVYGSTPRLVIQGNVIPASANYNDAALFQNVLNQTTAFDMHISMVSISGTDAEVRVVVKKVDASNLANLQLFGAVVEDTLDFNANNGESKHYNVFRKAIWSTPLGITAPANVGDSVVHSQVVSRNTSWNDVYAMAILHDAGSKQVLQAAKSPALFPASVNNVEAIEGIRIYPNPVADRLFLQSSKSLTAYVIYDLNGKVVKAGAVDKEGIYLQGMNRGMYFVKLCDDAGATVHRFVKE